MTIRIRQVLVISDVTFKFLQLHVEGKYCNQCISGYFGLDTNNTEGCMKCYCSGVAHSCTSSKSYDAVSVVSRTPSSVAIK